jgi:hypothetical protein
MKPMYHIFVSHPQLRGEEASTCVDRAGGTGGCAGKWCRAEGLTRSFWELLPEDFRLLVTCVFVGVHSAGLLVPPKQ